MRLLTPLRHVLLASATFTVFIACTDTARDPLLAPVALSQGSSQGVENALAAQARHTAALMRIPGVVGTAVGLLPNGEAVVRLYLEHPNVAGLPDVLDGVAVSRQVTGRIMARSDPTLRLRPAPVGYSVGHPAITAGTIGARVVNPSTLSVFLLSNNHVLANSNGATVGDAALQPGPFDGGTSADQVGTLFAFRPIDFSTGGQNTMDAAIALTSVSEVSNSTPLDDGYGIPSRLLFNDANSDGQFDNIAAALNTQVQKFGRTTKLTHGTITGVNGTLSICYEVLFIFCIRSATFVDQLIIEPGNFSDGGDSGSLIVTDNSGLNPVGLLFAGSTTQTIANRIDLVLNYFSVTIDDGSGAPPTPLTDAAISSVSAPASVSQGATVNVSVTVQNSGNQPINSPFSVALQDVTGATTIGTQNVAALAVGAVATLSFSWNTTGAALGGHTLTASHDLSDGNAANNQRSTTSSVNPPGGGGGSDIHLGNLDGIPSDDGTSWSAVVEITVHDASHAPINGATAVGSWSRNGLNANTCTSGDLGGNGTCIVLFPGLSKKSVKSVTFTVNSVTMAGRTYAASLNHDPDGSSNGTSVKVNRP